MDEQTLTFDPKPIRRAYSYAGFCYTVLLIAATVAQLLMSYAPVFLGAKSAFFTGSTWMWLCMTAPLYLLAMPLCFLMMTRLPAAPPEKHALSAKQIFALIPICILMMYAGNLIGTVLSLLLSGGNAENAIAELASDNHPLKFVMMVIAAPILEEWICRKVLLDRVRHHGELLSAVMSGAIFGLLHQNFFQFFYAFALGLVFSWIYLRCGRLIVPILFHMGINFLGSVIAPALLQLVDMEALETLSLETATPEILLEILPGYLVMMLYSVMMIALAVTGLIVLLCNRRNIRWEPSPYGLPLKATLKPAWLNVGMIVYTVFCAAMFALSLFAG